MSQGSAWASSPSPHDSWLISLLPLPWRRAERRGVARTLWFSRQSYDLSTFPASQPAPAFCEVKPSRLHAPGR